VYDTGRRIWTHLALALFVLVQVTMTGAPSAHAQGPSDDEVRFDRAVFDTGIQNTGAFIQDRDGFLWLGTNGGGLFRYDAYQTKVYKSGGPNSLPDMYISALYEDSEGLIWIGMAGSGLVKYDKETDTFTQYRHDPTDPTSIGGNKWLPASAVSITEDRDGVLWVGNTGGLNALDRQTGVFTRYQHDPRDPSSLNDNSVRTVFVDQAGVLWVGTDSGLDRFDRQTGAFTRYVYAPDDPRSFGGMVVNSIAEDRDGLLWLATRGNGLLSFDRDTETFVQYAHDPDDPNSPSSDQIMQVYEDSNGMLWLVYAGPERMGISAFDRQTGKFTHYTHDPDDPYSLSSNVVTRVYEDRAGILWMVSDTGLVNKLDSRKLKFELYRHDPDDPNSLISDIVVTVHEDSSGMLWIGTFPGLQKYDKRTHTFTRYIEDAYFPGIYKDSAGVFWLGASVPAGLHIFDRATGQIVESYTHDPADPASLTPTTQINMIIEDRNAPNILWIATSDSGVEKFDKQTKTFTHYTHDPSNPNSLGGNNVSTLYQDREGYVWAPMIGGGLNRLDPRTDTITRYTHDPDDPATIGADSVNVVFEDSAGVLWVGTVVGFDRLDRATGVFTHYTEETGFLVASIGSINEDEDGNLWMGSLGGGGLIKFDPRTEALKVYRTSDGLQGDVFFPLNGIRDHDGEMWFGGSEGLNSFYPREIVDNAYVPSIALTALKQGGEDMALGAAPERVKEIVLDWRHNFFEFEYTALNFTRAEKNQYRYMLEGWDKDWFNAGTRRFGRYSGLRGGEYTLRIIGSNNDSMWNEEGVSLRVKVTSPWWETWWFYALGITSVLGIGLFIYRSKSNQIKAIQAAALALQKSERNYREVFNATSDALFIQDETARVVDVNDRMCAMFGYDHETALGLSFGDISLGSPPYSQPEAEDRVRRAVQEGPQVFEWQCKRRNGEPFWSEVALHASEIAGEKRVIASVRDITERKRTEAQLECNLRETHVRFEVSQALAGAETEDEVLDVLIQHAGLYPQAFASIVTFDRAGGEITGIVRRRNSFESGLAPIPPKDARFPASQYPLLFLLLSADRSLVSNDVLADEKIDPSFHERARQAGIGSFVAVPLTAGNEWMGLIFALAQPAGYFDEEKQHLYQTLAEQGAAALRAARLRETIRESQQRLSLLVQQSPLAVIEWNSDLQVVSWNPAAERIFGYTHEEALGRHASLVVPERAQPLVDQAWQALLAQKGSTYSTNENLTKDGRSITCEWFNAPLIGAGGQVIGIASLVQNITKRKQAEEALRESEERYRLLAEAAHDLIFVINREGNVDYINSSATQQLGRLPEEILGRSHAELFQSGDAERQQVSLCQVFETGQPLYVENPTQFPNRRIWLGTWLAPIKDEAGQVKSILGISRDITECKQAETERTRLLVQIQEQAQRVQQIVDTVPEGVLLLDAQGCVVLANPTAAGDLVTLAGARVGDILTHLGNQPLDELLTSPPKGLWHELATDGRVFQIIARPLETGPTPGGWVLVIRDVTQQRELDRRVQQRERLAAVGQLAAGIAHDFNNIMATIVLYAQITARSEELPASVRERMATISQQAHHATTLIRQILDFSRRSVLKRQPLDLLPLLKEQVQLLERTLPESIRIEVEYEPDEYIIVADLTSMQQMMTNLALNARDAMPQGGRLRLGLERIRIQRGRPSPLPEMKAGEWVRITVSDTGVGIPPDALPHIFEPFFTTKAPGAGSGLGLPQVHGIVGQHEGHIDVETLVGEGTTFAIYLPALLANPESSIAASLEESPSLTLGKGETILIVEDNAAARQVLVDSLQLLNYQALEATNGQDALRILEQRGEGIALVLSDVVMPVMGGVALLHALREQGWTMPVVMLTGHPVDKELKRLQTQGLIHWLPKPSNLEQLAEAVAQALREDMPNSLPSSEP
jgi:PAS domain S-box-containing protein